MRDIAEKAGYSTSTVSLALSNSPLISSATIRAVKSAARALKYKPNATISEVMSKIRKGKSDNSGETIAIFNARTSKIEKGSALEQYFNGAIAQAKKMGYIPLIINLHAQENTPQKISQILKARNIRGGIVAGHYREESLKPAILKVLKKIELVAIGIKGISPIMASVVLDRFKITYLFTRRIRALGHRRIGFVIERFADIFEEGKLVGGYLRAQVDSKREIIPPYFWKKTSNNIAEISKYIKQNKLDALFSYSTAVSRELTQANVKFGNVKIFHADNAVFKSDIAGGVKNRSQVGAIGVKILSEILRGRLKTGKNEIPNVHSVPPRWTSDMAL